MWNKLVLNHIVQACAKLLCSHAARLISIGAGAAIIILSCTFVARAGNGNVVALCINAALRGTCSKIAAGNFSHLSSVESVKFFHFFCFK